MKGAVSNELTVISERSRFRGNFVAAGHCKEIRLTGTCCRFCYLDEHLETYMPRAPVTKESCSQYTEVLLFNELSFTKQVPQVKGQSSRGILSITRHFCSSYRESELSSVNKIFQKTVPLLKPIGRIRLAHRKEARVFLAATKGFQSIQYHSGVI